MSAETIGQVARPRALDTILAGGLIAGVLDGLDAVIFYRWSFGVSPTLLFQHIASGLFGTAIVSRRVVHRPPWCRVSFLNCIWSGRRLLWGQSGHPGAVAEALGLRPHLRSAGISFHALRSGTVVGGDKKDGPGHGFGTCGPVIFAYHVCRSPHRSNGATFVPKVSPVRDRQ
jgi:hypothetical protein